MSEIPLIAVVDDDEAIREAIQSLIRSVGLRAAVFASAEDFLHAGQLQATACLIVDVRMPRMSGIELQRQLATTNYPMPIIFITAHGDEETRARCEPVRWPSWTNPSAMRSCSGPFRQRCRLRGEACKVPIDVTSDHVASQMVIGIEHTLDDDHREEIAAMLADANLLVEDRFQRVHHGEEIIGESPALKDVLRQVEIVAPTDATVLLQGETGTGKERLAHAVHQYSSRRDHPFVTVNCAAIPSGLLESELFGHERGAFTGAIAQKLGRFELAHQGTLFLDEIGDIPVELQPKLLRVLQEQAFERLGSTRTQRVDVRLVAATNRELAQLVDAGHFRADLYYRLNVFPIAVPPLRQRPEDIHLLVRHFVRHYAQQLRKRIDTIPTETLDALTHYAWPGNVRELQNVVERAVILSPGPVLRLPLDELPRRRPTEGSLARVRTLEEVEREHILRVLRETNGVIGGPQGAATRLGLRRTTLLYRMEKLGISRQPQ
jgi:formate hydrogenlyase transcriptional activator